MGVGVFATRLVTAMFSSKVVRGNPIITEVTAKSRRQDVEIRAMVQMEHNRKIRQQTGLNKLHNIILSRIFAGLRQKLKDKRGLFSVSCLHDP